MTDRGTYRVMVEVLVQREILVHADGSDEAEEKAKNEAVLMTGGFYPMAIWSHQET